MSALRSTSPRDSVSSLPISSVMYCANSSRFSRKILTAFFRIFLRSARERLLQSLLYVSSAWAMMDCSCSSVCSVKILTSVIMNGPCSNRRNADEPGRQDYLHIRWQPGYRPCHSAARSARRREYRRRRKDGGATCELCGGDRYAAHLIAVWLHGDDSQNP